MPLVTSQGYNLTPSVLGNVQQGLQLSNQIEDRQLLEQQRGLQLAQQQKEKEFLSTGGMAGPDALSEAGKIGLDFQKRVAEGLGIVNKQTGQIDTMRMDKAARFATKMQGLSYLDQQDAIIERARTLDDPTQTLELLDLPPEERKQAFELMALTNLPSDQLGKAILAKQGISTVKPSAASEQDRQFKQLQSMPDSTPEEKKAKKQYATLIKAEGKRASLEEKTQTQQAVGDIKVQQDIKKQQEISNIKEEQAISTARKKTQDQRIQGFIDSGVESADNLMSVNRSIELMDSIETGGIDQAIIKAKQTLGIESADEAELSYELGKSVLKQLKPTFGAAFTVNEMLELKRMESGLGKSVAGNKRILSNLKKMLKRSAERGMRAAKDQGATFAHGEIQNALGIEEKKAASKAKKEGGVLKVDANGNRAIVYPDGSFEEVK